MSLPNITKSILLSIITLLLFFSCNSNDDGGTTPPEAILQENYYFKGSLDGVDMNIEKKIYNTFTEPTSMRVDFGPSQTDDDVNPDPTFCYGLYACGILPYTGTPDEDRLDSAKMLFYGIPVGDCTLTNELTAMRDFLSRTSFAYEVFPGNVTPNSISLEYFPKEYPNGEVYFSSRFGDNTNASFQITSVNEIETGVFIVEGTISCKLYKFNEPSEFKVLENGSFRIKISNNLDE